MPINEMNKPIIARVLGFLKIPIKESSNPKNQTNQPRIGIQPIISVNIDSTKPAVPTPLLLLF